MPEAVATHVDAAICKHLFKVLQLHLAPVECTCLREDDIELSHAACAHFGYPAGALDDVI